MKQPVKLAVLGGGMSAMSTVYELLKADNFQGNYDITVYQMGWRIGGKGASGRQHIPTPNDPENHDQRILEHGLHAWFGWYTNSFNQFKDCYKHLDWGDEHQFNTWEKAFTSEDYVAIMEEIDGDHKLWNIRVPAMPMEPGGTEEVLTMDEYLRMIHEKLKSLISHPESILNKSGKKPGFFEGIWMKIKSFFLRLIGKAVEHSIDGILERMEKLLSKKHTETLYPGHKHHGELLDMIERLDKWIYGAIGHLLSENFEAKKFFLLYDIGKATMRGFLADDILNKGLNSVNNLDYREWLTKHGANQITVNSVLVRTIYDGCFAYSRGDKDQPNIEAGVALRYTLGIGLGSKGHWLWKMNAGMGDTIFSPYYFAFKKYGVKFKFFHKVEELKLSEDKTRVDQIIFQRQAEIKPEYKDSGYQPTFSLHKVDCWPSEPLYDQLIEGEELKRLKAEGKNVSLESAYTEWPGCNDESKRKIVLEHSKGDFDIVLLNIPIAGHMFIAPDLVANNQRWYDMIDHVQTNQTIATQLWTNDTSGDLGWPVESKVSTGYVEPLDTYSDMTHLCKQEENGGNKHPKNITYLVSAFPQDPVIPPFTQHNYKKIMTEVGRKASVEFLQKYMKWIFPKAMKDGKFDWSVLYDPENREGEARMESQYVLVNVDPAERYTLSVRGSSDYRLRADESGYENLFFAGDWTDNGLNIGCIETCVISGMRAAAAISGKDIPVVGDNGLYQMT